MSSSSNEANAPRKRLTGKTNPEPQIATGKRLTKKTEPTETSYGEIHRKSVNKIIHMLGRTIKMKVTKSTPALKKILIQ